MTSSDKKDSVYQIVYDRAIAGGASDLYAKRWAAIAQKLMARSEESRIVNRAVNFAIRDATRSKCCEQPQSGRLS